MLIEVHFAKVTLENVAFIIRVQLKPKELRYTTVNAEKSFTVYFKGFTQFQI